MSSSDNNALSRQQLLLLQKLSTSEESNRALRDLLRKQHSREVSGAMCLNSADAGRLCGLVGWNWFESF